MTQLTKLTLLEARDGLLKKEFTSVELTQAHIEAMEKHKDLNAYITPTPEIALNQAKESDVRYASNTQKPMDGLPIGIKDLFCTKGIKTTAASKILGDFTPPYESTVTQNLLDAGTVHLGKLNLDEFAMGSANITSAYGNVKNPWKSTTKPGKDLVPGGSSGGSSAAVAADIALAATGTDTGGSIRQPASFCGLVGIKPTYGLCSRYGVVAFASSLDQAGPITKTVTDAALMLSHMASFDPKDATSLNVGHTDYLSLMDPGKVKGLRVGLPKEYLQNLSPELQKLVDQTVSWLKDAGAELIPVSLPMTSYALPTYYIIAPAEASSNLARYDGVRYGARIDGQNLEDIYVNTRSNGFGDEVKRRILIGTYVLSAGYFDAYYTKAQKVRTLIAKEFEETFKSVDILLTPTTPSDAFPIDEKPTDPVTMYLNDIFTVTVNLAGLPGLSVPVGLSSNGLPLSMQLIGPKLSETLLLSVGKTIEDAAQFKRLGLRG